MKLYNREYNEFQNDFEKMWEFIKNDYKDKKYFIWTLGRLGDWKFGIWNEKKYIPSFLSKNARLWFTSFHELVGFVISEEGDNAFCMFTKQGYEFLYEDIMNWVVENWKNRGTSIVTEVHEHQENYMRVLEDKGFVNNGLVAKTRKYNLQNKAMEEIILDSEFRIVDMKMNQDYKGKRLLQENAFRNDNDVTEISLLAYEYSRECPCYNPYFDLSVIDKEGVHVAGCCGFVDYENKFAEIERVCTHSEYRRRGFAEAVIRECFKRLTNNGFTYAYITGFNDGANHLYDKLGAVEQKNWYHYELPPMIGL